MDKVKNITSEQVFDILPFVMDIFDKLDVQKVGLSMAKKNKTKDISIKQKEVGMDLIKYVLKNSNKVKDEFFAIVAIMENITVDEAKDQGIIQTLTTIKGLMGDKDLMGFFSQSMQSA